MSHSSKPTRPAALANWLMIVAFLVVLMVAVGGITRLTESGLSITQWKPITGAIPPLSEAAWQAEFALYQTTGEYQTVTGPAGMDLAAFKFIFFWEWFHRLLGRLIGLAFAVPLAWFWMRGAIPQGYKGRLVALLALGGLQGVFGWFMVRSGLAGTMTDVSHFWLSIHLLTALFTLGGLIWTALDLRQLATGASRPARWTGTASWVGAILSTLAIFAPGFLFVAFSQPLIPRLRASVLAGALLDGVVVASLGLMTAVTWHLGRSAIVDLTTAGLALGALTILVIWRPNSTWLVLGGALAGWFLQGPGV